ncbi:MULTISPECIES: type II toxin-antitoxin system RelE/ParE family toxin [Rhizobium]|uniref:type II toxin-antitoxin system RelE/ParE family toxin n=1 Tax=Rhizobium TaxID=379 RepID=UPI000522E7AF|nr:MULTISPECIES: type II toxin-antitoxin system RelE/ParE family toxin [Rhizobium]KAF5885685.1 type II toxin-antitoxin system RelE/ParE family toxin [Rhizobium sp. PEPV16]KPN26121.1 plasmid stabilization protein [Rhizobium brockwellii]MBY3047316.1 type II toxin-antitoxin system RelE/ParE family toxin [Rhizobium leguminosarum]MBY5331628.1 type II toxin-antitoxin system RelE/ParE family toxin [Rhizobium leguminosarum]MBY5399896.1 type II toxin-antitoxin system RelE/ParE family toxin [Rhizobium l
MVALKVVFRPRAEKDLLDIYAFIAADNSMAAMEFIRRLRQICHGLEDMPERGAPREDFAPGVRILVFERRVTIAYRVVKDRVQILRLFYAGRNTPSAFREN